MSIVTQSRIASKLGVSQSTVAKALHPTLHTKLSPQRRQSILEAVKQMGYVPNRSARSLSLGRTHTLIMATIEEEVSRLYAYDLIHSLHQASAAGDYQVVLHLLARPDDFNALLHPSTSVNAAGLIFVGAFAKNERFLLEAPPPVPVVVAGFSEYPAVSSVTYDRAKAMEAGVAHLLAQGHRRVAMVRDPADNPMLQLRLQGYRAALRQAGLDFQEELLFPASVDSDVRELWARIANARPRPTAVISFNDELAFRLEHAMLRAGVRVPDDVALVTANNSRLTVMAEVPLTALDMNNTAIAKTAMDLLLAQIQNPTAPPRQVLVDPFLVVRASSTKQTEDQTTKERQHS